MKTYHVTVQLRNGEVHHWIWGSRVVADSAQALELSLGHLPEEHKGTEKKVSIEVKS